jgi:hypothetical protein
MYTRIGVATTALVVALPFILETLWKLFPAIGAVPYLAYQLYYAPMALWLAEPFFGHDDELGILVRNAGVVVTAVAYVMVFIAIREAFRRWGSREAA